MQSASAKVNAPQNKPPQQLPKKPKAKAQPQKQSFRQPRMRPEALSHLRRMNDMLRRPLPCGGRATRVQAYFGSRGDPLYANGSAIFNNIQRDHVRTWYDDALYFNVGSQPTLDDPSVSGLNGSVASAPSFDVAGGNTVRPLGGYMVIKIDAGTSARGYMWTMPATIDDVTVSADVIASSGAADAFGGVFVGFSGINFAANDNAPVVTVCYRVSLQIMLEYANLGLQTKGVVQTVDRIEKELEQMGVDVKVDAYQQLENVYDDI